MNELRADYNDLENLAASCGIDTIVLKPHFFTNKWEISFTDPIIDHRFAGNTPKEVITNANTWLRGYKAHIAVIEQEYKRREEALKMFCRISEEPNEDSHNFT